MHPAAAWPSSAVATPAHDSWTGLYDVFLAHAQRYLELYYPSEDDLANDQALGAWIERARRNGCPTACGR